MTEKHQFIFDGSGQERLDKYLVRCLPDYSRSRLQNLVKDGFVEVNGEVMKKVGLNLEAGSIINIEIPDVIETGIIPEEIPLNIIFENEDVIIVNKAAGMVVHPAVGHASGTLVHAALAHAPEMEGIGGEHRPGIVHRLDKDTSGLILMAKNDRTHRYLQDQFRSREVHKTYLALTDGHPPTPNGRVEAPIGRDPSHRKQMAIVSPHKGREAVTNYKVVERYPKHSLVEAYPLTGRTHQIRLHLSFLECPIVGDQIYGHRKLSIPVKRQMLHAYRIEIKLPGDQKTRIFEAQMPEDMQEALRFINR